MAFCSEFVYNKALCKHLRVSPIQHCNYFLLNVFVTLTERNTRHISQTGKNQPDTLMYAIA